MLIMSEKDLIHVSFQSFQFTLRKLQATMKGILTCEYRLCQWHCWSIDP